MKTLKSVLLGSMMILALGASTKVNAQKLPEANTTVVLNASADEVWERLRKIEGVEEITPSLLSHSELDGEAGVGCTRVCTGPDGKSKYKETVIEYNDASRFYSYKVIEGVPIKGMVNSFRVVDLGYNKCMVVWHSNGGEYLKNPGMSYEQVVGLLAMVEIELATQLAKLYNKA